MPSLKQRASQPQPQRHSRGGVRDPPWLLCCSEPHLSFSVAPSDTRASFAEAAGTRALVCLSPGVWRPRAPRAGDRPYGMVWWLDTPRERRAYSLATPLTVRYPAGSNAHRVSFLTCERPRSFCLILSSAYALVCVRPRVLSTANSCQGAGAGRRNNKGLLCALACSTPPPVPWSAASAAHDGRDALSLLWAVRERTA